MRFTIIVVIVSLFSISIIAYQNSRFVVNNDEQVVIVQNGRIVKSYTHPGVYFKLPIFQKINYFTKKVRHVEFSHEAPTIDKVFVSLTILAYYKIVDPTLYYKNNLNDQSSKNRVRNITEEKTRIAIINETILNIVNEPEENLQKGISGNCKSIILRKINYNAKQELMKLGIELVKIEAKCNV